ncbi:hypothetical protein [Nocardioides terrisoli]|uniref:hypothetical protein n=1 Tax=Nocardioides terrisoli TaxID=3388267 RepID=UPI00287B9013|nr:hypothetical protein [Nocardioides marmorisolisilvae]
MQLSLGAKVLGWIFLIAIAVGFEIENPWVFLAGVVLEIAWLGRVLTAEHAAHTQH